MGRRAVMQQMWPEVGVRTFALVAGIAAFGLVLAGGAMAQQPSGDLTARVRGVEVGQAQTRSDVASLQAEVASLRQRLDALAGPAGDEKAVRINVGNSPIRGNPDAPITLVIFEDYQSDYGVRAHYTAKKLLEDYPSVLRVIYKHYPLTTLHPQANEAALAAIGAEKQGKFWELNDLLFQNSRRLDPSLYITLAEQAGLNLAQFERDRRSVGALERLSEDEKAATDASVTGVPAVFLNGRPMPTWRYDYLRAQIEQLRKK